MPSKNYFRKPVFLPSGGLDYPPFVWLQPVTNELTLYEYDANRSDSNFAYKLTLLEKYLQTNVDLLDMYTSDINYLWSYMMIEDVVTDGIYYISSKCSKSECEHINHVKIDMGVLSINYLNIYDDRTSKYIMYENDEGLKIKLSRRRAKHNLSFGHILFSDFTQNKEEHVYQVELFIATQIEEIIYNGMIVPRNEYMACLRALRLYEIDELLYLLIMEDDKFGIHNRLYYECKKCKEKNMLSLFNDFQESKVGQLTPIPNVADKQKGLFKHIFEFTRLPIIGYNEYINAPIRFMSGMANAVQLMEFHSGITV